MGITYVDTAPAYGTETIVGVALAGRRNDVVLSTKTARVLSRRIAARRNDHAGDTATVPA